jgi:uncharacterized HAD superfamily protein
VRIGIDIDDVLYPWADAAHKACRRAALFGPLADETPATWRPYEVYGVPAQRWFDVLEAAGASLYQDDPIPGAVEAIDRLMIAGHTVHLVTARGGFNNGAKIRRWTVEWLDKHEIPFDSLTFSADKTVVNVDMFIDDNPDNYDALDRRGTPVWLVGAVHNGHAHNGRRVVASLAGFADMVLAGAA